MEDLNFNMLVRKVDLLTLRLFLTVIEERHLVRAAARENIAPSAVTKRIHDFEDTLGLELFYREPKGVILSSFGHVVADHVRQIFDNLNSIRSCIGEFQGGIRGHVRLATTESIIVEFLAADIGEFIRLFPSVDIDVHEDRNPNVIRSLTAGTVDLAVYSAIDDAATNNLEKYAYRQDRLVAILPRSHPRSTRQAMLFHELLDSDFVGLSATTSLMMQMEQAAVEANRTLNIKYRVASNEAARALVRAELACALQPEGMVTSEDMGRLAVIPLLDAWAVRHMHIAVPNRKSVPPAARALLDHLRSRSGYDLGTLDSKLII
jgi:DNA-binding transcriptional LysR family regulator